MEDKQRKSEDSQSAVDGKPSSTQPEQPLGVKLSADRGASSTQGAHKTPWNAMGLVLLCFLASFLGAWLFVGSGLIKTESITPQVRQKIVSVEGDAISKVAGEITPSVVSILTESQQLSLFDTTTTQEAAGTGLIISTDGYIMTNKHVIPEGTTNVQVVLADGTHFDNVKVIGRDKLNDIAFLKLSGAKNLKPAVLGDSSRMKVGERVVAVGNALGQFETTVTSGIISGLSRDINAGGQGSDSSASEHLSDLLQTDAAINPGNSGGPLVNLNGEVIGMNTAVADQAQGIGFAIPINATKGLIKSVTARGELARAYLGVHYISLTPDIAKQLNLSVKQGAVVRSGDNGPAVIAGSPADKAGLKAGDVVTKVNGQDVTNANSLALLLSQNVPGDTVTLTYLRDGNSHNVSVTLEKLPNS